MPTYTVAPLDAMKARIGLVFSVMPEEAATWPYRGFSYSARAAYLSRAIREGLPDVELAEQVATRPGEFADRPDVGRPPRASGLPEPRRLEPLLALAFSDALEDAASLLEEVASEPLPLRSVAELEELHEVMAALILYGYAKTERDVLRVTDKGLYALLQLGK